MLWLFDPNQKKTALFDAVWEKYIEFANHQQTIADASTVRAFCDTLRNAAFKLVFAAENATLSPKETDSIIDTTNAMIDFHEEYYNKENISNPDKLKNQLSALGQQMAEGMRLGWEYKLSGQYPKADSDAALQEELAINGNMKGKRPRAH